MTTANQRAQRNRAIIEAVAKGDKVYDEIAKEFGLTRARIDQLVQHEPGGMEARAAHKAKKTAPKLAIIEEAIANDMTYADIVAEHGRNTSYWRSWAAKLGKADQIKTAHEKIVERNDEIIEYLNAGHTQLEAAKKFNLGQSAISSIALSAGQRKRLTGDALAERNQAIIEDLNQGMTGPEVAEKYDVSTATVYNAARSCVSTVRKPPAEIRQRNKDILADVNSGMSFEEVSEKHQVSLYVVRNVVNSAKIKGGDVKAKTRLRGDVKAKRDAKIAQMYAAGVPVAKIAEKFSLSIPSIYAITHDLNVERTNKGGKPITRKEAQQERDTKIVVDYIAGKTYTELAKKYGVCVATVYQAVKKSGNIGNGNPRGRQRRHSAED